MKEFYALLNSREISEEKIESFQQIVKEHPEDLKTIKKSYNALDEDKTIREAIHRLVTSLSNRNKSLLLLDGYDPDYVASKIHDQLVSLQQDSLKETVMGLLQNFNCEDVKLRIPNNANWTNEMYHQIRLAYERAYGTKLISDLIERNVSFKRKRNKFICLSSLRRNF